jgi:hypothetical protein
MFSTLGAWHSSRSSVDAVGSRFEHHDDATRQTHDRPPDEPAEVSETVELRKEAWVMALYVAVLATIPILLWPATAEFDVVR